MTFWRDFAQGYATSGSSRGWTGLRLLAFRFWQCLQLGGASEPAFPVLRWRLVRDLPLPVAGGEGDAVAWD